MFLWGRDAIALGMAYSPLETPDAYFPGSCLELIRSQPPVMPFWRILHKRHSLPFVVWARIQRGCGLAGR